MSSILLAKVGFTTYYEIMMCFGVFGTFCFACLGKPKQNEDEIRKNDAQKLTLKESIVETYKLLVSKRMMHTLPMSVSVSLQFAIRITLLIPIVVDTIRATSGYEDLTNE